MLTRPFIATLNEVSVVVAFTILSVAAIPEIAVPSVRVALSPLLEIAVIAARPSTASDEDVSSTAM